MRILLMTRNRRLASAIDEGLSRSGHTLDHVRAEDELLAAVFGEEFDALILELDPAGRGECRIVQAVRAEGCRAPVLTLTDIDDADSRIACLDYGADDCLSKPFDLNELVARVRALVRRRYGLVSDVIRFGALEFDCVSKAVSLNGEVLPLTRKESATLEILMAHRGRTVNKERIHQNLYGFDGGEVRVEAVELYISRIRKKLGATGVWIKTNRHSGYQLCVQD
jgi:DNA-binding response OmpR family regulator